ncbi:MAG TPA: NUDIX hydrolase [Candidatus Saccharimonadales bacterium]|nr:NUDIX hydrolase [Candidatus Saccharimonadales bacterium]
MKTKDFSGVKIALFCGGELVMVQRDDKPGLRFAGLWDFPGGAREGRETPLQTAVREVEEELSLKLKPESIVWQETYPAMHDDKQIAYFMVAELTRGEVEAIKLGDEGQEWRLMDVEEFFDRNDVVGPLKGRLTGYLKAGNTR